MMNKVAIPSNDQITIAGHFGRAAGFMICEVEGKEVLNKEYKSNNFTGHAQGHHHQHAHGNSNHSHKGIFEAIGDCQSVIAGGMGRRLYNDFEQKNIQVFVTRENDIDTALQLYLNNSLDNNSEACCDH